MSGAGRNKVKIIFVLLAALLVLAVAELAAWAAFLFDIQRRQEICCNLRWVLAPGRPPRAAPPRYVLTSGRARRHPIHHLHDAVVRGLARRHRSL